MRPPVVLGGGRRGPRRDARRVGDGPARRAPAGGPGGPCRRPDPDQRGARRRGRGPVRATRAAGGVPEAGRGGAGPSGARPMNDRGAGERVMGYSIIDVDSHVTEPADVWTSRVARRHVERVPQVRRIDGADIWFLDGERIAEVGSTAPAGTAFVPAAMP